MAPPGFLSLYDNMEININTTATTTQSSSSSLLLSPFPSFADCMKHITVYSDHNYFFKNNSDNDIKNMDESRTLNTPAITDSCFDLDIPTTTMDNKSGEVMTPIINDDSAVSPGPSALSNGRTGEMDDSDNVFNDVTLVNRLDTPAADSSDTDTDFLLGLDDLEFDFDEDYEPSREGTLESFIDAALEDTVDINNNNYSNNNNNNNSQGGVEEEEEEDIYKKEFFFKHLRLQRAASYLPKPTPNTTTSSSSSRKNRKRKHEDSESSNSHQQRPQTLPIPLSRPCCLSISTSLHESRLSYHLPPHIINKNNNNHNNISSSSINNNNTVDLLSINNNSTTTQNTSSSSHFPHTVPHLTTITPLSVPSKLCSCASSDWKSTILYSTAKSSHVTSVQTSPSTASLSGIPSYHRGFRCESSETSTPSCFPSDIELTGRLSPSLILSDKAKDCFEFDLLDKSDMDEDTKDLLQWLDNQEVQTTIAGITSSVHSQNSSSSSSSPLSISSRSGGSESDYNSFSSSSSNNNCNNNNVITADDLEAILSPQSQQQSQSSSSWELDRFQDLEAYVLDGSTTTSTSANESHDNGKSSNNDVVFESDDVTTPKHHQNQLRLSILSDISRDFLNSEYTTDSFKSSHHSTTPHNIEISSHSTDSFHQKSKQSSEVAIISDNSQYWMDSPPLSSPSSSVSSSLSSPPHSPSILHPQESFVHDSTTTQSSNNLDLLDLFSDENNAVWCL